MHHLYIDPKSIPPQNREEIAGKFRESMPFDDAAKMREQFDKPARSRKIKMWLTEEKKSEILKWWLPYAKKNKIARNALFFIQDYKRSYPYGKLLGQVLQSVREDRDVHTNQAIPTGGLELYFHNILSGKEGKRLVPRSPRHYLDEGEVLENPVHGADVYLTIDPTIQAIVEEELEVAIKRAVAKEGWAVMMDPNSGEILALAHYPFFSPQEYRKFYSDPDLLEYTRVKAICDAFEPGSVIKPVTAAILLLANQERKAQGLPPLFDPDQKMRSDDGHVRGRRKPISDIGYHKYLNLDMAMQKSANIYLVKNIDKVIQTFGNQWYRDKLTKIFGFSKKMGIEIPSEGRGMVPRIGKRYKSGALEWSVPTPYSLAIGYNFLANALQMTHSYATLANGGHAVKPTLIKKIVKDDNILYEHSTELGEQVLPPEIVHRVIQSMRFTTQTGGTAFRARIPGYSCVGKTSTSEKLVKGKYSKERHRSSFLGFAPMINPRFVLMVVIDDPEYRYLPGLGRMHYGGKTAAPAFKEIGKKTLRYLGVTPDDPDNKLYADEAKALTELYKQWNMK